MAFSPELPRATRKLPKPGQFLLFYSFFRLATPQVDQMLKTRNDSSVATVAMESLVLLDLRPPHVSRRKSCFARLAAAACQENEKLQI